MGNTASTGESANGTNVANNDKKQILNIQELVKSYKESNIETILNSVIDNSDIQLDSDTKKFIQSYYRDNESKQIKNVESVVSEIKIKKGTLLKALETNKYTSNEKQVLTGLIDNLYDTHVKYKSLEYRYVELNVFLMGFLYNIYNIFKDFDTSVLEITRIKDESVLDLIKDMPIINDGKIEEEIKKLNEEQKKFLSEKGLSTLSKILKLLEAKNESTEKVEKAEKTESSEADRS
jgi:hypothetical protein